MKYTVKAHRTKYANVWFRSRLEARWAAFFGLIGWRWEYEPIDLPGWSPDFVLRGKIENVLVEVKPVYEFPSDVAEKIEQADQADLLKEFDGFNEALILGVSPNFNLDDPYLGWLRDCNGSWALAPFVDLGEIGFCHEQNSYHCRITDKYDGNWGNPDRQLLKSLWAEAGNRTQWRPRA